MKMKNTKIQIWPGSDALVISVLTAAFIFSFFASWIGGTFAVINFLIVGIIIGGFLFKHIVEFRQNTLAPLVMLVISILGFWLATEIFGVNAKQLIFQIKNPEILLTITQHDLLLNYLAEIVVFISIGIVMSKVILFGQKVEPYVES